MPGDRSNHFNGQYRATGASDLARAIDALERSLDPLFAAGRYRDFFDSVHAVRTSFRDARISQDAREDLWSRLNRIAEAAKRRQAQEFAVRDAANLARWRDSAAAADRYAAALTAEIDELAARTGAPLDLARWRRRIAEKEQRRTAVQATLADLQRKIADVQVRHGGG